MKKPYYKQEVYIDKHKTLSQAIMFKVGDMRAASHLRSQVNPNLEILKKEIYLDENMQPIEEEEDGKN